MHRDGTLPGPPPRGSPQDRPHRPADAARAVEPRRPAPVAAPAGARRGARLALDPRRHPGDGRAARHGPARPARPRRPRPPPHPVEPPRRLAAGPLRHAAGASPRGVRALHARRGDPADVDVAVVGAGEAAARRALRARRVGDAPAAGARDRGHRRSHRPRRAVVLGRLRQRARRPLGARVDAPPAQARAGAPVARGPPRGREASALREVLRPRRARRAGRVASRDPYRRRADRLPVPRGARAARVRDARRAAALLGGGVGGRGPGLARGEPARVAPGARAGRGRIVARPRSRRPTSRTRSRRCVRRPPVPAC